MAVSKRYPNNKRDYEEGLQSAIFIVALSVLGITIPPKVPTPIASVRVSWVGTGSEGRSSSGIRNWKLVKHFFHAHSNKTVKLYNVALDGIL